MARLDNIIPENLPIHFIKIDVEGAELLVFKGGLKTIHRNKPLIVFEHGIGAADYYDSSPEEVYDLLIGQCDLQLTLMETWLKSNGANALSKEEFCRQYYTRENHLFLAY